MQSFQTIAVALFCFQQQLLWYKMATFIYMSKLISYLIYNTILFFRLFLRFSFHIYALSSTSGGVALCSWTWRTTTLTPTTTSTFQWYVNIEQAATKIQAVFRGHKVRASMKQGDSSANSNNSGTTATATSNASQEQTQEELKAEFREDDKGKWWQLFEFVFSRCCFICPVHMLARALCECVLQFFYNCSWYLFITFSVKLLTCSIPFCPNSVSYFIRRAT